MDNSANDGEGKAKYVVEESSRIHLLPLFVDEVFLDYVKGAEDLINEVAALVIARGGKQIEEELLKGTDLSGAKHLVPRAKSGTRNNEEEREVFLATILFLPRRESFTDVKNLLTEELTMVCGVTIV